jgi:hypothetical protein
MGLALAFVPRHLNQVQSRRFPPAAISEKTVEGLAARPDGELCDQPQNHLRQVSFLRGHVFEVDREPSLSVTARAKAARKSGSTPVFFFQRRFEALDLNRSASRRS